MNVAVVDARSNQTILIEKDVDIPMRDGARLKADVFRPDGIGSYSSSARRSRSRPRTSSGTRPLTSPPYRAISLTRLELR